MCNKMSDVRLSNASPTVERVDARQPDNQRPPVRRSLFGTSDPEETRRVFTASMEEGVRGFRETYNFDPEDDTPLPSGNFVWEQVSNPAEFYVRPPHRSQQPQRDVDLPGDNNLQDVEERQENPQPRRDGSRKRRREALGSCSSECPNKRSHTDEDDDEDQSKGAGSQAVKAAEERPCRPESSAEVQ
ncbi:cyclin-dependent kinase inhibitor 1B-like [Toxotes jaculatrix]|uniref:cyclin-dependent kinase inhibitor 1B-like n=1 Tax=Toxotes jaculatrix TaxID=941984 RepID=UPI001B3ACA36|nr:cyclin-dependent kinase inhibitor 1B-like [Toxotes jaculatrix]